MVTPKQPRSLHTGSLLTNVQRDLEILFTSTSEAILMIEAKGTILAANEVGAKWLRHNAQSLVGENLFQLHSHINAPIEELVQEVVSKKTILESDFLVDDRCMEFRLIPVAEREKVTRLIIIGKDVTEHKRVEEQVREFTEQMERKVRERTKKLEALNQKLAEDKRRAEIQASLSHHLMQDTQDYGHLLEHITTEISDLVGDTCLIALFATDLTFVRVQAITDRNVKSTARQRTQLLNRTISVEGNAVANSILKGERYSTKEVTKETGENLLPTELALQLGESGLVALEVFPLQAGESPLGLLAIARDHGNPYSDDEISFVGSLAGSVALAIQNAHLFEQLTESQNQLRGLSQKLVQVQENHFKHLAAEMHDQIGQDMTAINVNLNILQAMLPKTTSEDIISRLADTEKLVQGSVKRMRSLMSELRPPMLDQYGLTAALNWYCEQYQRRTNIELAVNDQYMKNIRSPAEVEIALFRIAQEALNNVAKHAQATHVDIELLEEKGDIMMVITDNGTGFDMKNQDANTQAHWGLTLMQERARAVNGKFLFRSVPDQGTQVVVRVRKAP
ncbi:MAG: ATP-binding protein [Anaerolineales bacterium]